jgi:hypothetical protein
MTQTVLVKTYPGNSRPQGFEIVPDKNTEEIKRLKTFGYGVLEAGKPADYTPDDAWHEYTVVDNDGFTQWK